MHVRDATLTCSKYQVHVDFSLTFKFATNCICNVHSHNSRYELVHNFFQSNTPVVVAVVSHSSSSSFVIFVAIFVISYSTDREIILIN